MFGQHLVEEVDVDALPVVLDRPLTLRVRQQRGLRRPQREVVARGVLEEHVGGVWAPALDPGHVRLKG